MKLNLGDLIKLMVVNKLMNKSVCCGRREPINILMTLKVKTGAELTTVAAESGVPLLVLGICSMARHVATYRRLCLP